MGHPGETNVDVVKVEQPHVTQRRAAPPVPTNVAPYPVQQLVRAHTVQVQPYVPPKSRTPFQPKLQYPNEGFVEEQMQLYPFVSEEYDKLTNEMFTKEGKYEMIVYKALFDQIIKAIERLHNHTITIPQQQNYITGHEARALDGAEDKDIKKRKQVQGEAQYQMMITRLKIMFLNAYRYNIGCFLIILTPRIVQNFDMVTLTTPFDRMDEGKEKQFKQSFKQAQLFLHQIFQASSNSVYKYTSDRKELFELYPLIDAESSIAFIEKPYAVLKNLNNFYLNKVYTNDVYPLLFPLTGERKTEQQKYCTDISTDADGNCPTDSCYMKTNLLGQKRCTRKKLKQELPKQKALKPDVNYESLKQMLENKARNATNSAAKTFYQEQRKTLFKNKQKNLPLTTNVKFSYRSNDA